MNTNKGAILQYVGAGVILICAVVYNIFGTETAFINNIFTTLTTALVWGGYQRQKRKNEDTKHD